MTMRIAIGALFVITASSGCCLAADPRYPDWPCVQAKVSEISLAAVWVGPPLAEIAGKWKDDDKVSALVSKLGARKTPLEEAKQAATEFIASSSTEKSAAGKLLFAGLFETLNAQRTSVMNGLERVTRKQREAAEKIRSDTLALHALQDASPLDQTKIDELSNQLIWEARVFEDRRRVIGFVCEVPTAIDQRLFALGRVIQQEME